MLDFSKTAKCSGGPSFRAAYGSREFDPRNDSIYRATSFLEQISLRLGIVNHLHQSSIRRVLAMILVLSSGLAFALGLVAVNAYRDATAAPYESAIATRVASPVYAKNVFLGAVSSYSELSREWSYLPLNGDPPKPFVDAFLYLEDRGFLYGEGLRFCGSDFLAVIGRSVFTVLRAGGSGVILQLQKNIDGPTKDPEEFRTAGKLRQIGRSCRLWDEAKQLAIHNGTTPELVILHRYTELVPFFNGGGSVNGLTAASEILYGKRPGDLTIAEQYFLAAALRYSLQLAFPPDTTVACKEALANDFLQESTTSGMRVRRNHCQIAQRALYAAKHNLKGEDLQAFNEAFEFVQKHGFVPVNPFAGKVVRGKLINLTSRSQAILGNAQSAVVRGELERTDQDIGAPIQLTLDGVANVTFRKESVEALDRIQKSPAGQNSLCLRLTGRGPRLFNPLCGNHVDNSLANDPEPSAQWLAVSMQARTGEIKGLALSDHTIWDQQIRIGSIAKIVIALAWTAAGHSFAEQVCARAAFDGKRPLHRSHRPTTGYSPKQCSMGIGTMSFAKAFSTSDNLAMFFAAGVLGDTALEQALNTLKLHVEHDSAAFATAFGTATGRPSEILRAYRALVLASQEAETPLLVAEPSLVVAPVGAALDGVVTTVRQMLDTQDKRSNLKLILAAPVQDGGTLSFLHRDLDGGKSGTVGSSAFTVNRERAIHSKVVIGHTANSDAIGLVIVTSPTPSKALALPGTGHLLFLPLQKLALAQMAPKERISQVHNFNFEGD